MWNWVPATLTPDGGGYCGGTTITVESLSECLCESYVTAGIYLTVSSLSESEVDSNLDITGWGTRSGLNECECESSLDIGNGLTIFSDYDTVSRNVNTLRFGGEILGINTTINSELDVTVRSLPTDSLDGAGGDIVSGGTSETTGSVIDGGNSGGVFSVVTFADIPYYQIIDTVSDFLIYKGWAEVGSLTSAPVWRIQKIVIGFDDDVTKTWAEGNAEFDNIWDDHLSLVYS